MNTIKVTTKQFAEMHKVDYALAAGFLRFMQTKNHVTVFGQQPNSSGKGKASTIYDVPVEVTLDLRQVDNPDNPTATMDRFIQEGIDAGKVS